MAYSGWKCIFVNVGGGARYLALGKFLEILRIEIENYSHHHDNGNVLNRTSMDTGLFNTNLLDEI
jgi:hypothetical protein